MRVEDPQFIDFGDVARERCNQQCQYASRYINLDGRWSDRGYPQLGRDLRFLNLDTGSYHDILIHQDDADEFVRRYTTYCSLIEDGMHAIVAETMTIHGEVSAETYDPQICKTTVTLEAWKRLFGKEQ